jgi:hypothetical protein
MMRLLVFCSFLATSCFQVSGEENAISHQLSNIPHWLDGNIQWQTGEALISASTSTDKPCYAIKDPTIVRYGGLWHLFCTVRAHSPELEIEYRQFVDWKEANNAERHLLKLHKGPFCAPQVFYFRPQKKWYLIYHVLHQHRRGAIQPVYSTNTDITDPNSWTPSQPLQAARPLDAKLWIDFWIICDNTHAHLFYTSHDGRLWRTETAIEDFPLNWKAPVVALEHEFWEGSHTYHLKGMDRYLTIIEAKATGGRRYYKAYVADRLDGRWRSLASNERKPFAAKSNVHFKPSDWADSISHGELLRSGYDEQLTIDPNNLQMLFQGVTDEMLHGNTYAKIPWQLGLLQLSR